MEVAERPWVTREKRKSPGRRLGAGDDVEAWGRWKLEVGIFLPGLHALQLPARPAKALAKPCHRPHYALTN
jgi:hypothetical protein